MPRVRAAAMFEPLVDTVDSNQICTSTHLIWEADLLTVTKQVTCHLAPCLLRFHYCSASHYTSFARFLPSPSRSFLDLFLRSLPLRSSISHCRALFLSL